ncbi:MAG: PD-(D/E)XK nuclease family protein, partial [Oscillospiraceae bacterium]|nr:PD-(D/E)XK nuclease family protein [Oscillospiraceae bacterium]
MVKIINKNIGAVRGWNWINPPQNRENGSIAPQIMVVPEQYSHEAERELAEHAGDSASLFAEVLTFSRLATRVFAECGGLSIPIPDRAAKLLTMRKAIKAVSDRLNIYRGQSGQPEFLSRLLALREEFSSCGIAVNALENLDTLGSSGLGHKLNDIFAVFTVYDALLTARYADCRDRITRMAALIGESSIGNQGCIRFEGFSDFTKQEFEVITELIRKCADITIVLYFDGDPGSEFNRLSNRTRDRIRYITEETGTELSECGEPPAADPKQYSVLELNGVAGECEFAARQIVNWINEGIDPGDIAVAAPAFASRYEAVILSVFASYGIPVYLNDKEDILAKPIMTLITGVYAIISGNWRLDSVLKYAKTNLSGITRDECDELENYCLLWDIKGEGKWRQVWEMNPRGYVSEWTDNDYSALSRINSMRERVSEPLLCLKKNGATAKTAAEQAVVLYGYMDEIGLAERLEQKSVELLAIGEEKTASEYTQLWEFLVGSLERVNEALQDDDTGFDEFGRLLSLLLAQYELSTIPPALHRVRLGEPEWFRESRIKRLILLGASDSAFPNAEEAVSLLSDHERRKLREDGLELPVVSDAKLERELYLAGRILSKADFVTFPKGERLSYLADSGRLTKAPPDDDTQYDDSGEEEENAPPASDFVKTRLSPESVRALYGEKPLLTASKVEAFNGCAISFWINYGLRAQARKSAGLDAPEFGTLMHYVLENVSRDVKKQGGFAAVESQTVKALAAEYCDRYSEERLRKSQQSSRFRHLFQRLRQEVISMVAYIASELALSRIEPIEFEHRLNTEFGGVRLSGIIDRVDALNLGDK